MGKQSGIKKREKFSTQIDSELLASLRKLADKEGRQIQALVEEAVESLIDKRAGYQMRPEVKAAYADTVKRYDRLLAKLAQ